MDISNNKLILLSIFITILIIIIFKIDFMSFINLDSVDGFTNPTSLPDHYMYN